MVQENKVVPFVISVVWGKSNNYVPYSNEPFDWDGSLNVIGGAVMNLDHLHYKFFKWVQAVEVPERIFDKNWYSLLGRSPLTWKSSVKPGDPAGLEGIRFSLNGNASTLVTIAMAPVKIQFTLGELMEQEHLRYHAGGKYSGVPIDVYLGPDARPRVSRKMFLNELKVCQGAGWVVMPDDFNGVTQCNIHSMYGAMLSPNNTASVIFPVENHESSKQGECLVKLQVTALLEPYTTDASWWMELEIRIGRTAQTIRHLFTMRAHLMKLEDIYCSVPWQILAREGNELSIRNEDSQCPLFIHRIYIGAERPSHREALKALPPLPVQPTLWIGYDTNLLTPQNGEMERHIQMLHEEEMGNYILFRERGGEGSVEDLKRWAAKLVEYNFRASTDGVPAECRQILSTQAGDLYLGNHAHEISNLTYGWGQADPIEDRINRTLPECQDFYLKRMAPCKIVGQAVPLQHLDYAAGVELVITEIPGSNASLCLAGARGASLAFEKKFWGVHAANHVSRCPIDEDTERRNFILLNQSWLYGARLIYDEEVALYYNHDTSYSFSDALPFARRRQYQALYHYGSAIELGEPLVRAGFLHGNYDCLIGGAQALPYIEPTKFWGMIGPETKAWEFDTPERGWELLGTFMPGVWLYPVKQDPRAIRQFFTGTPHGQVDLVPITADARKLGGYELLVLPGWNTMTEEIHRNLLTYVEEGGHLVLCAAQCTEHITRDFLIEKRDFRFFRNGDLRELAGVRLGVAEGIINSICFPDERISASPGLPGLQTELYDAEALATDQSGHPVLIENKVGAGRVWMLTVGEYWGHPALDGFRRKLGEMLVSAHPQKLYLSGNSKDLDFHCFQTGDTQRVVLLNTDWTSAGNSKSVLLHTPAAEIPLKVREGSLTQVLLQNDIAVIFETLPVIVDELRCGQNGATFRVSGAGVADVRICTPRKLKSIRIDGQEHAQRGDTTTLEFGVTWITRKVEIVYV